MLTAVKSSLVTLVDAKLQQFDSWLLNKTFLVGHVICLADLLLYAMANRAIVSFPKAQHGHFCNLIRWYDNIHYMADPESLFPRVTCSKPKFSFNPISISAPSKGDATGNGNKEEKDKKKAKKAEEKAASSTAAPATPAVSSTNDAPKGEKKKDKKGKGESKGNTKEQAVSSKADPTIDRLDIRVGLVTAIKPHPNADSLYVEEIDLGEEAPRTVVSGLRKFVTEEAMLNRKVVVVCNLKPAKMRDIVSYGMVLCASNSDHTQVDPIRPPEESSPSDKVCCEGYDGAPDAQIHPKKKIFEQISPDLKTDKGRSIKQKARICFFARWSLMRKKFHAKSDSGKYT